MYTVRLYHPNGRHFTTQEFPNLRAAFSFLTIVRPFEARASLVRIS